MNFEQYMERVEYHFERLGVETRPTHQAYIEAWNNQMPAKKMAQTVARRQSKADRLGESADPSEEAVDPT